MPRRKQSDNIKSLHGEDRPSRLAGATLDFPALEDAPAAPDFLEIEAKQYWDRIVPILRRKKVLSIADLEGLAVLCALYGRVCKMLAAGVDVSAATVTQLRLYQTEFGLTPASRNKIAGGDDGAATNPFASHGRRPGR